MVRTSKGAETPEGAQAKVDAHAALAASHGQATIEGTVGSQAKADAAQAAAAIDATNKVATHAAVAAPHSGHANLTTQSVVTGSRAINTVYQNTSGKPMLVTISGDASVNSYFDILTDANNPPTTVVARQGFNISEWRSISFLVLPGNYYKLSVLAGTPTPYRWTEWT